MTKSQKGTILVLISAIFYSLGGLMIKMIPWDGFLLNAGRSFISIFVYGIFLVVIRHKPKMTGWVFFGAVVIALNNTMFAVATKLTAAGNVAVLQFIAPVFIILISFVAFHKLPTRLDAVASAIVIVGIICFFVDSVGGGNFKGDLLAVSCGLVYAIVFMLNEMPGGDPLSSVFWSAFLGTLFGIPSMVGGVPPLDTTALLMLLGMGLVQTGAAYLFLMVGMQYSTPIAGILTSAVQPILSPVLVAAFYGEYITPMASVGAVIVVVTIVVYNILKERALDKGEIRQLAGEEENVV